MEEVKGLTEDHGILGGRGGCLSCNQEVQEEIFLCFLVYNYCIGQILFDFSMESYHIYKFTM